MKKINPLKTVKRAFYRERLEKFKRLSVLMLAAGAVFGLLYFGKVVYTEYAAARAYIVLTYPEIASSSYPDGERFTVYTLSEDSKIEAALQKMQAEGKYQSYTVEDIKDHLFLYSYLKDSAGASVSAARSAGNDYTYVANEYRLTYIQQHDYKNRNIFKRIFSQDYSADFLKDLVDAVSYTHLDVYKRQVYT